MSKPSIPKGTRDFLPQVMVKRNYIFDTIKAVFQTFGYLPIETPTMEKTETLMGKYGEEGDRLIFKVLNSGDYLKGVILNSKILTDIFSIENFEILHGSLQAGSILFNQEFRLYSKSEKEELSNVFKEFFKKAYSNNSNKKDLEKVLKISEKLSKEELVLESFHKIIYVRNGSENLNEIKFLDYFIYELIKHVDSNLENDNSSYISKFISEKALRYDLTVPFARFVVQNRNEISLPFKRYQIQPVWRADRPQRGRYREFYQCDVDVVGSDSLLYEVELIQIFDKVLSSLKLDDFTIKINNRKILSGLVEVIGESDKLISITVAIDKLDKIGEEGVVKELRGKEVSESAIEKLKPILTISGSNEKLIEAVNSIVSSSEIGAKGIEELKEILEMVKTLGLNKAKLEFDPSLARGLNYYTGAIFEVKANNVNIGSVCGGGRYDDLTSIFGMKDLSGVGVSFGADRIYDVLEELDLFPKELLASTQLMFANFGTSEAKQSMKWLKELRENDIPAEIYPDNSKLKKQMTYANNKNIPFVALVGENELANNSITVKNMETGDQNNYTIKELVDFFNATRF